MFAFPSDRKDCLNKQSASNPVQKALAGGKLQRRMISD